MAAREWENQAFVPTGGHSSRSLTVGLDDQTIVGSFFSQSSEWFSEILRGERPNWGEATGLANFVPDSLTSFSTKQYVGTFGRKAFDPQAANRLLEVTVLPAIPRAYIEEEVAARRELLTSLNVAIGLEALLLQHESSSPEVGTLSAALKLALPPLWRSFLRFADAIKALRIQALDGCDFGSQQVRLLMSSSPFAEDIFGQEEVDRIKELAFNQVKLVQDLISFKTKKQASSFQGRSQGKRNRHSGGASKAPPEGVGRGRGRSRSPPSSQRTPGMQWIQVPSFSVSPRRERERRYSGSTRQHSPPRSRSRSPASRQAAPPSPRGRGRARGGVRARSRSPKHVGKQGF